MLTFCDAVLAERNDLAPAPVGQHVIWTHRIDPVWPNDVTTTPISTGGEQGDPPGHLGECAREILQTPALWSATVPGGDPHGYGKTYLARAKMYVAEADVAWDGHIFRSLLDLSDANLYRFTAASPYKSGQPVPWNQQMMFSDGLQNLAECHWILGDDSARATRYAAIVKANIDAFFHDGVTSYTDADGRPAFDWAYVLPGKRGEDSNHGALDVAGFHRAFTAGLYGVTSTEMTTFANTIVDVMNRGPGDYAGSVDGTDGDGHMAATDYIRSSYLLVAQFRPDAYLSMMSADLVPGAATSAIDRFSRFLWVKNQLYPMTPANLAPAGKATASTQYSSAYPASASVDGNEGTRWASAAIDGQWWQVDLGSARFLRGLVLHEYHSRATAYSVLVSTNGQVWSAAYHGTKSASLTDTTTTIALPSLVQARYVKLRIDTASDKPSFREIEVMGH